MPASRKTTKPQPSAPAVVRECVFIHGLTEARAFAAAVLRAAALAGKNEPHEVVLALSEPAIGIKRLADEWTAAGKVLRPEIWQRMALMVCKDGDYAGWPKKPTAAEWAQCVKPEATTPTTPLRLERGGEVFHDILRVLIRQWMEGGGAVSGKWLCEAAGCSHPTLARALRRLARYLNSPRPPVSLTRFPTEEWGRLLASSDRIRQTCRFAATSPDMTVETLEKQIHALRRDDLWLGGVTGARHYFPGLDLVGTPRLDVTMPSPAKQPDVSWVAPLGLRAAQEGEAAMLAIHAVHFPGARCEKSGGKRWADPVECLLDLHDARLESQALEFLNHFATKSKTP